MNPTQRASPTDEQLRKILEFERRGGFKNEAVSGGLDRLLKNYLAGSAGSAVAEAIGGLGEGGYRQLGMYERNSWLENVLLALEDRPARAPTTPRTRPQRAVQPAPPPNLDAPVTALKGLKGRNQPLFEKLDVHTVRDMLFLFPRRHIDYSNLRSIGELTPGQHETIRATVWSANERRLGAKKGSEVTVGDDTGMMKIVWFRNPYVARQLRVNSEVLLSGKVGLYKGRPTFQNPEWEIWDDKAELTHAGRLLPVYPLTQGLHNRTVRRFTRLAIDGYLDMLPETLPETLLTRLDLMGLREAVSQAHYPDSMEQQAKAIHRLALEELLPLQLSVLLRRRLWQESGTADPIHIDGSLRSDFLETLPFTLTGAQQKALDQLLADLDRDIPMSRLLQGDVGSGKTVVAACALVAAVACGRQAVMMAPTEVLADQHFKTLKEIFDAQGDTTIAEATPSSLERPLRLALLQGTLTAT